MEAIIAKWSSVFGTFEPKRQAYSNYLWNYKLWVS